MSIKELYRKDKKSLSPKIGQMFNSENTRKDVSKMFSMKIELSKMSRKGIIPIKDKRIGTGAK
jgi:hypothetical protein